MSSTYRIRWKGRTEGPYTRKEISKRLKLGELSVLHRIEINNEWHPLSKLLDDEKKTAVTQVHPAKTLPTGTLTTETGAQIVARPDTFRVNLAYALCGLTFLLPVIASLPALLMASGLRREGRRADGDLQLALIALFTVLGLGFWNLVRLAFIAGRLG